MSSAPKSGLGITFSVDGIGQFRVVRVHSPGPSDGKGIEPDDRLISINGVSVNGRSFDELASVIDSATGPWYTLRLGRQDGFGEVMLEAIVPNLNQSSLDALDQRTFQNTLQNRTRESYDGRTIPLWGSAYRDQPAGSPYSSFEQLEIAVPRSQKDIGAWGEWTGVGISISFDAIRGFCHVTEIQFGGGAHQSGLLRVGDVIAKVDGEDMRGMKADEVALAIRGSPSSAVHFTVLRSLQQVSPSQARGQILPSSHPRPSQELLRSGGGSHNTSDYKAVILERAASADLSVGSGHVGISCQRADDGTFMVQAIAPDGPAGRDGNIHVGDLLMEVNGVSVRGYSQLQLQQVLSGPIGSKVHLRLTTAGQPSSVGLQTRASAQVNEDEDLKGQVVAHTSNVAPKSTTADEIAVGGELLQMLSVLTAEDVAHQIRMNIIKKMSTDSILDSFTVFNVHILLCASLFVGLSHTEMLEVDMELSKDHFGSKQPEATSGPWFYVFSPLALISVFGFFAGFFFVFLHFRYGHLASIYIFSRRSGLSSIALYGNPFVAVTILLVYWHLSKHPCCNWVSNLSEPMLIVMLPVIVGVLLYFLWAVALEMLIHNPIEARLRAELLPVKNLFKDSLLGALLIAGVVLLYFKLDDRLDADWMVATSPLQAMLIVILFSNYLDLIRFSCLPKWKHPSSVRLALMGTVDSAALEVICVFVFTALDDPKAETDLPAHRIILIVVVSMLAAIYTIILVYDVYTTCGRKFGAPPQERSGPPTPDWLQPVPLAVVASSTPGRVALRVTWPAPDEYDGKVPFASFRLELCAAPPTVSASRRPTVLRGEEIPAHLLWTAFYTTEQQVAVVEGLVPASSYILRVTARWNSVQDRAAMGPLVAIRIPDRSALGIQRPPKQPSRAAPQAPAAPPVQPPATSSNLYISASPSPTRLPAPAAADSRQPQAAFGAVIPAPLVLKAVRLAGQGGGLCAVFEWVQQRHFASNILDLQLLSSTNPTVEPHDYMMVYAGPDASVRVYNIEPSSMYVARLRAGDIDVDEMATVVERCQLPFRTPSVEELLARDSPPLTPIRASYRSEVSSPAPPRSHPSPSPRRPHWLDDMHSSRSPLLVREAPDLDDSPYPDASLLRRLRELQAVTQADTVPLLPAEPRNTTMAASPVLLPNGMSQWVPLQYDPRRTPSPPPPHAMPFPQLSPPPPYSPVFGSQVQPAGVFAAPFPFGQATFQPAHPIWL